MLLECRDIDTFYGDSQALDSASLSVDAGEQIGILGRNGMGKTTLVHTIMGMLKPRTGTITLDGLDVTGATAEKMNAAGVSVVPQGRRVFGSLTVGENLQVAYRAGGASQWTVDGVCDRLPILRERWSQLSGSLSGGQKQMLALGRAMVGNGRLVLLDEPSEGLDQHHLALTSEVVREWRARGTAVLVVEQKLNFVADMVDVLHVMSRGHLVQSVTVEEFRTDPQLVLSALGFGAADASHGKGS